MRHPNYISSSQYSLWERDREEYYLQQLANTRPLKSIQTKSMSVGSAFDAYVKSAMFEYFFGKHFNPKFEFNTLFEEQVLQENRDWALIHGKYLFNCYKISGAYSDLLDMIKDSEYAPQFEFTVKETVKSIPLLGKPDLRFIHKNGAHILLDWKVSGYCSKYGASPVKYYKLIRDGWKENHSKSHNTSHKKYKPFTWKTLEIHKGYLEEANKSWANQLAIYSWLLGEKVGSENTIVCIDQLISKPNGEFPLIRIANQRSRISSSYQIKLINGLQNCWNAIKNNHIFDNLTLEESKAKCETLERRAEMMLCKSKQLKPIQNFVEKQRKIYKF